MATVEQVNTVAKGIMHHIREAVANSMLQMDGTDQLLVKRRLADKMREFAEELDSDFAPGSDWQDEPSDDPPTHVQHEGKWARVDKDVRVIEGIVVPIVDDKFGGEM